MAYEGEILNYCPANLDFSSIQAVIVSGASANPCGHAILFVPFSGGTSGGSNDGMYFQVVGNPNPENPGILVYAFWGLSGVVLRKILWYPLAMTQASYHRYIRENKKTELGRLTYSLVRPYSAYNRMIELMQKKWFWGAIMHNCATFVEVIAEAGGTQIKLSKCPIRNLPR
jgi:hypothetical protein